LEERFNTRFSASRNDPGSRAMTSRWDEEVDVLIVGSGAAAFTAGIVAAEAGQRSLILEKTDMVGGSTAMSGGVIWAPNNALMRAAGVGDSYELARTYLDACVGDVGRASTPARRHAFLTNAPKLIDFLVERGMRFIYARGYSDYHETEHPGGLADGRSLVGKILDARELGAWQHKLRRNIERGNFPLELGELRDLAMNGRTWRSKRAMLSMATRLMRMKFGQDLVGTGSAIQGRLLRMAVDRKVPIRTGTEVTRLLGEDGRITGVQIATSNGPKSLRARRAVLLNSGGFARSEQMRDRFLPQPSSVEWTNANPGETGEILELAIQHGAATALMDQCWWVTTSILPDGSHLIHPFDMGKPYCIMVDSSGSRYVNEATSYVAVGNAMYERQKSVQAVPSWLVLDSQHRQRYRWGAFDIGEPPAEWIERGYMKRADSIEGLATQCAIDPARLATTVARFNGYARRGEDPDFNRGKSAYDRLWLGDPDVKPNGTLGALEKPPFYAVQVFPGDVGTCGGLVTDESSRVLREDGSAIPGLYAAGNVTASVLGRAYPGAGASIAAGMVFGYIAAQRIAASTPDGA
jgi:3-oxosteroid 1-dehydrogenase